jgi:L-ribulose-5-phosphate 3-epimerase
MDRLQWTALQRKEIKDAIDKTGVHILTMCLSGNRKYTIGSEDPEKREKGIELIKSAIRFSVDIGIRIVQLASYDEYYNDRNAKTEALFVYGVAEVTKFAAAHAVTLAFETMDTDFIDTISKAMRYVSRVNSPWLQVYPDIANLTARGKSAAEIEQDFLSGFGHIVAIHLKDAKIGEIRRVPFGEGIVDFDALFKLLQKNRYSGLFVTEMWSDDKPDALDNVINAQKFIKDKMSKAVYNISKC